MDNTVSGRDQPAIAAMLLDPGKEFVEERLMPEGCACRPMPLSQEVPRRVNSAEMRRHADSLDLAIADERQIAGSINLEECEFDARGACVDGEDITGHGLFVEVGRAIGTLHRART
jgi:hypothetical protein